MGLAFIRRLSSGTAPYFALAALLLIMAYMLSAATQDSSKLNDLLLYIFGIAGLCILLLVGILSRSLFRLYRDFKEKIPGSRLTLRLVSLFVLLVLVATTIVYSFSVHFLHRGINSWFDVQVEQAVNDSLELSKTALGIRLRTLLRQTRMMAGVLSELPEHELSHSLRDLSNLSGAVEMSIWSMEGTPLVSSIISPILVPERPNESVMNKLMAGEDYIGMEEIIADGEEEGTPLSSEASTNDIQNGLDYQLRAAVRIPRRSILDEERMLNVLFPVNEHLFEKGRVVQEAYDNYAELSYLRKPLVTIFTLSLSLIVLLTVLATIWFAIWISRRIVEPLQELAEGTQAVSSGIYNMQLTSSGHDEIGFLVRSFNQMTQRLTQARNASQRSHRLLEQQTSYLTTVLGSLSSGVITVDERYYLHTANQASTTILGVNLQQRLETPLNRLAEINENMHIFCDMVRTCATRGTTWEQQIELQQPEGTQTLICHGTLLPNETGWVVVFEDISTLIQAHRYAAWGEVARRLAHEIKNPLTPIQLSAERLQRKYSSLLSEDQLHTMNKLTNTIVNQVEAMKEMVDEFSDYARTPSMQRLTQPIDGLIREVMTLYRGHQYHRFDLVSEDTPLLVNVDANRFRQVLHNLFKNAIEAAEETKQSANVTVEYQPKAMNGRYWLTITIEDNGPGIPANIIDTLFEPYATTKPKGTGLGLAIVKKIIEEHGGQVWAENLSPVGARIIIQLPLEDNHK